VTSWHEHSRSPDELAEHNPQPRLHAKLHAHAIEPVIELLEARRDGLNPATPCQHVPMDIDGLGLLSQ
jgi:hypothetical protein